MGGWAQKLFYFISTFETTHVKRSAPIKIGLVVSNYNIHNKCGTTANYQVLAYAQKVVVSINFISTFFMPFSYKGVYWVDLLLSICDVIVSQKPYNEE